MRRFITPIILSLLVACSTRDKKASIEQQIRKVETSLVTPVHIKGDSTWTIEERMKHYGVPGVSLAVIVDGKIAWSKTYGIKDKETNEPVTSETLFQAGSISKPVAAYGALKAVELEKIDADESVNKYLTSWKVPDNDFTRQQPVTLKHLLSHTGGLTVHGFPGYSPGEPIPTVVQVLNGEPPANTDAVFVNKVPGESFRYSGGGYTIMQQMLVDIEGKPFPVILNDWVLAPLDMTSSTYNQPLTGDTLTRAATGYLPDHTQTKGKRHTYPEMAAAGLWTTAEDLARFAIDIQSTYRGTSNKVLSQQTVKLMLSPYIEEFIGMGIFIQKKGDDVYFEHGGWDEGFSSHLMAHRDNGVGAVVLTNSNHPAFIDELIRSVALTYNWPNYVPSYEKQELSTDDINAVKGKYRYDSNEVIIIKEDGGKLLFSYLRWDPMQMFKVNDSSYVRKERTSPIMFKVNPADGKRYLVFTENKPEERWKHPLMAEGEKIPFEYLVEGDWEGAVTAYKQLRNDQPNDPSIQEGNINREGYNLLDRDAKLASLVFKMNVTMYPTSANTYDSYGDALLKLGDKKGAMDNFRKALSMDPSLEYSKTKLEELLKEKN